MNDQEAFAIAVEEAKLSYQEGGVPIGAALISRDGKLLGRFVFSFLYRLVAGLKTWEKKPKAHSELS